VAKWRWATIGLLQGVLCRVFFAAIQKRIFGFGPQLKQQLPKVVSRSRSRVVGGG
jgi:hypothetical protein